MVNFAKLAAEAKARRLAEESENGQVATNDIGSNETGPSESEVVLEGEGRTDEVPPASPTPEGQSERPKNRFGARKDSGQGGESGPAGERPAASSGVDSGDSKPRSALAALSLKPESQPASSDTSGVVESVIDSLDALDQSTSEGVTPRERLSGFADETPADKPTRELPEGLDKDTLGFVDMIDGVYEVVHDAELLGSVIRNIMMELKDHPEYMKLVQPTDIRVMVKGMRESMGLAKIRKMETKAKRSGGAGKKSKLVDDQMLADLEGLGVEIPE